MLAFGLKRPMRWPLAVAGAAVMMGLVGPATVRAADADLRLVAAAANQDRAAVRALVRQGANVNAARADGATALLWAAHWDDLELVDLLVKAGARVDAADDHGVTPLARAAENASVRVIERLLRAGANPNRAETSGRTPLMIAARTGNVEVVKHLLAHGADVNASTATGATALMWAVGEPHPDVVKVLVEGRADVRASNDKGFTPLMFAARNGDIDTATQLLEAGARVNDVGVDGTHVLPFALVMGQATFATFLIERGADPNGAMAGVRALHAAAGSVDIWLGDWYRRHGAGTSLGGFNGGGRISAPQRAELVRALLAKGANVNAPIEGSAMLMSYIGFPKKGAFEPFSCGTGDLLGATPLWVAAYAANGNVGGFGGAAGQAVDPMRAQTGVDVIQALLSAGADQRLTSVDGTTPLMVAAGLGRCTFTPGARRAARSEGAEQAVKALVAAGGDVNAVNEADFTALHGAAMRGLNEVIQVLVDEGARIDARDFRGRTAYRLAEGSKQSFQFQAFPDTAEFIKSLGADAALGLPGTVQERLRDVASAQPQP